MNDEQSKRLSEAADALIQASDALEEARETMNDRRFDSEQERDRIQAAQQMTGKLDNAGKKVDDAVRKCTVAAAATGRPGTFAAYKAADLAVREARGLARRSGDQDGTAAKKAMAAEAVTKVEGALASAAVIVFGE
jgi:hypothetical protein